MNWGDIELEPEVEKWFLGLSLQHRGTAAFYSDAHHPLDCERALRAMRACVSEEHTANEE